MNKIWGYPLAFIRGLLILLVMAVFVFGYLFSLIFTKGSRERTFALRRNYLRIIMPILNIKSVISGHPHDHPGLYVCNHRTFADPLIPTIMINAFVIAKAEIAEMPLLNKAAELTGVIYVKRDNRDSRSATRKKMIETIKEGYNVLVYPEGTTNDEKELMRYLNGTFNEVAKIGAPVIPMVLEYRDGKDMWKDRSLISQYFRQFSAWKTETKLTISPAIYSDSGEELHSKTVQWSKKSLAEMQKNWSRAFP